MPDWILILIKIVLAFAVSGIIMAMSGLAVVLERKVASFVQGRIGPNRTNIPFIMNIPVFGKILQKCGLFQLAADGLKFLFKEEPIPGHVHKVFYNLAPIISLAPVLCVSCVIPWGVYFWEGKANPLSLANFDLGLLFALAISSLSVYGAVLAGWSSNSKFSYLGAIRASAQMISYELAAALSIIPVLIYVSGNSGGLGFNPFEIVNAQNQLWFAMIMPVSALVYLIALFAESNRQPFDMAESESDLVGGFHTEYGAFKWGLFYMGEYGHIIVGSSIFITLFLGGFNPLPCLCWPESWGYISSILSVITFLVKLWIMLFFFVWVRWTLPRFRYDQVMKLGWSVLVPLALINLIAYLAYFTFLG